MKSEPQPKTRLKLPPLGLVLQLFAVILLPLTILLVVVTFGSISVHQQAMRTLVGERDERVVISAASVISAQLDNRLSELTSLSLLIKADPSLSATTSPVAINNLLKDFDGGVGIFEANGRTISTLGNTTLFDRWTAEPASWRSLHSQLTSQPGKIIVSQDPENGASYGIISEPGDGGNALAGAFSINSLAQNAFGNILPSGSQLSIMLVGADHQVLYKSGNLTDQTPNHPGVAEALLGQSGTKYVTVGRDEHVTTYSPVSTAGWALITEESWESVVTPTLRTSQIAPLVLVPAVLIMMLALYLGGSQVVRPLRSLEERAATLAGGDFKAIQEPVGGIAEIQHLQDALVQMAGKVQEAERSLHGYIGAITDAQEEERRRLARELHDDTLQALIALKQRVQLEQLDLQSTEEETKPESARMDQIIALTEQTIENLRRVTRALRPIYLEDLGLVPALEMLVQEMDQTMGGGIKFHHLGVEKRMDATVELSLYRIAQEALNNVIYHAQAKNASITLHYSVNKVTLQITDDGKGFLVPQNPSEYALNGHFGLLGLHERAELIGAMLDIQSSPRKGTQILVTLPIQQ